MPWLRGLDGQLIAACQMLTIHLGFKNLPQINNNNAQRGDTDETVDNISAVIIGLKDLISCIEPMMSPITIKNDKSLASQPHLVTPRTTAASS